MANNALPVGNLLFSTSSVTFISTIPFAFVFFFFLKELLPDNHPGQFVVAFCP